MRVTLDILDALDGRDLAALPVGHVRTLVGVLRPEAREALGDPDINPDWLPTARAIIEACDAIRDGLAPKREGE